MRRDARRRREPKLTRSANRTSLVRDQRDELVLASLGNEAPARPVHENMRWSVPCSKHRHAAGPLGAKNAPTLQPSCVYLISLQDERREQDEQDAEEDAQQR